MPSIRHFIGAKTTKQAMFEAISTPEGLKRWWATSAKGRPRVGEALELDFAGMTTLTFRYDEMLAPEKLVLTCIEGYKSWQGTVLTHEIEEKEGQIFLTHIHSNLDPNDVEALTYFNTKWTVYLLSLKRYVEEGKGTPFPLESKLYFGD